VAHLVSADLLVLLTDAAGLFTADPKTVAEASLIEEVIEIDHALEAAAGGPGSEVGSGGMASKLAAAKMATWSGVRTVIADAARPGVLESVVAGEVGVGTIFRARQLARRLPARKLWIAFAVAASGTLVVDDGARRALLEAGRSLLPSGVVSVSGAFGSGDAVEIATVEGWCSPRGWCRCRRHAPGVGRPSDREPGRRPAPMRWCTATTWSS